LARRKYLATNPEQMEKIDDLLEEYRTAVKNKRIHLKPIF
jgi:DNA mismatch repair ATPase MutL